MYEHPAREAYWRGRYEHAYRLLVASGRDRLTAEKYAIIYATRRTAEHGPFDEDDDL